MEHIHAALKLSAADADEGDAVPVGLIHIGLDLEHECRKSSRLGSMGPAEESRGRGGGERRRKSARNGSTPKFVSAEPKNTGVSMPWRTLSRLNS